MRLFSTDIDGTVHDGTDSSARFAAFWRQARQSLSMPPMLVYNTGRSLDDALSLVRGTALPPPDFIIAGVGTMIFDYSTGQALTSWHAELEEGWDFERVRRIVLEQAGDIKAQPAESQNPYKCSWFWHGCDAAELDQLRNLLDEAGLAAQVVYSSARDLDILPRKANKGNAVRWLANWLGIPLEQVVVAGDSGNDASMFMLEGVAGIVVGNAEKPLLLAIADRNPIRAEAPCADGVIEALRYILARLPSSRPMQTDNGHS